MRLIFLCLAFMASLGAEAQAFKPRTVSSNDLPVQSELIFVASPDESLAALKAVVEGLDWKLLYEGNELPPKEYAYFSNSAALSGKSYDRIAWDRSSEGEMPPKWYVQAKTKTTAMSFGAELFVTVFETPNQGSVVAITASSSQAREKNRLETYIDGFAKELNGKIR